MQLQTLPPATSQPVTTAELKALERYLEHVWRGLGTDVSFTTHFLQRVNDPRNGKQITIEELQKLFTDTYRQHGRDLVRSFRGDNIEGVLRDASTAVNSPFSLQWDGNRLDLIAKSAMRKRNFVPHSTNETVLTVEQKINSRLRYTGVL